MNEEEAGSVYSELIMDLYKNPVNAGSIEGADLTAEGGNPLCGDKVTLYVTLSHETLTHIRFLGNGCAISIAAESILTHLTEGKTIDEVLGFADRDLLKELGPVVQTRLKCALLGLHTLKEGLRQYREDPHPPKQVRGIVVK